MFTYMLPLQNGNFEEALLVKAEKLGIESASLAGNHTTELLAGTEHVNNIVNCYYANELMFKNINITTIDDAIACNFSGNIRTRQIQDLCLCYLKFQDECKRSFDTQEKMSQIDIDIIPRIHNTLSSHPAVSIFNDGDLLTQNECTPLYIRHTSTNYERILYAISVDYISNSAFGFRNVPASILIIDGMLSTLEGYSLWSLSRGLFLHSEKYKYMRNFRDPLHSPEYLREYLHLILDIALEQISFMKERLKINILLKNLQKHILTTREDKYNGVALPKYSELLLKELFIQEEVKRGDVKKIIGTETRTATTLIHKLIQMNYIQSDTKNGKIRLKFNEKLILDIFPDLIL